MSFAEPPMEVLEVILKDRIVVVVGAGIVSCLFVYSVLSAAEARGIDVEIVWVFDRSGQATASGIAGAFHSPFASKDPRLADWARRSFADVRMLTELGLLAYVHKTPSLFLSKAEFPPVPQGSPGPVLPRDPSKMGFPYYASAAFLPTGRVFSTNKLMDEIVAKLKVRNGVKVVEQYLPNPESLVLIARSHGARVVLAGPGFTASDLFPSSEVEGDLGVLLRARAEDVPPIFREMVIMDEDDITRPTYSIPQTACGVVGFGGTTSNRFTWPADFAGAHGEDGSRQDAILDAVSGEAKEIRLRVLERFPDVEAISSRNYETVFQFRPAAARVILEVVKDVAAYQGLIVVHANGLGGSGYTIAPAVVQDALKLVVEVVVQVEVEVEVDVPVTELNQDED